MTTKILLDTDIGSDIDDAVCLAYLLNQPECELLGITTVSGEGLERAMLASALCRVAGKSIPIYPGPELPLLVAPRQPHAAQAEALQRWPHDASMSFQQGQAIEFMRQTIREHPHEVILLAIGPLTNVALLFRADAEIPSLLKGLVMMCGSFGGHPRFGGPEWNVLQDPHAAAIVFDVAVPVHRSIGLNVTEQVTMPAALVRQRFQTPLLRPVLDFAEIWFRRRRVITFHDPLAAATIFDEQLCTFQHGTVAVDLSESDNRGTTSWTSGTTGGAHEVAVQVDVDRFFDHYFAIAGRQ